MKKYLLSLIAFSLLCTACSPTFYQQIATLSSENVSLKQDGSFVYKDDIITIEYDFWAEYGQFGFLIANNSDEDIYLNLAESYFVNNGYAQDYYQARTYVYTSRDLTSLGSTYSATVTGHASVSATGTTQSFYGGVGGASLATSKTHTVTSVEFEEKAIVCIPAHSFKIFEEFNVATSVFRECGFARDPSKNENAVREYNYYTSPQVIENRLVFNIANTSIPITNTFYISQYQNISTNDATEYVEVEKCDGNKKFVKVHRLSGNNKFYITYNKNDLWSAESGYETDR